MIADELIRLGVVDYITDTTVGSLLIKMPELSLARLYPAIV